MTFNTVYNNRKYSYTQSGPRARLTEDGITIWWGDAKGLIPSGAAPIAVLLEFSILREVNCK